MPCFTPLKAYKGPGGTVVFDSVKGYSDRPIELPCGQCRGCRAERARQWALRCVHEAQMHEKNSFVTLTYSPSKLPADGGLHIEHWQEFARNLRKRFGKFRYFHCGEYGDENRRPHYHACIFGLDFSWDREVFRPNGFDTLYTSKSLESVWARGFCTVGSLTYKSAEYVARYVMKKLTGQMADEEYLRVNVETGEVWNVRPPYVTMSRRPGIGTKWFEEFASDVFPADEVVYDGRRFRPPRFYTDKLDESVRDSIKAKRKEAFIKRSYLVSPERLKVREELDVLKEKFFKRGL